MISVVCGGEVRGCGVGAGVQGGVVERCEISGLCDEDSIFFRQTWQTLETGNKDSLFLFSPLPFVFLFHPDFGKNNTYHSAQGMVVGHLFISM